MDKFSIDDVRDSFAADISAQITALLSAGRSLAESPELGWLPEDVGQPQFTAVIRAAHTVYGTCALVDTKSLYESARLLHIAGSLGVQCMREIERQIQLSRSLAALCIEGSRSLEKMLALELNHRGEEAWTEALALRQKLSDWEDARQALERPRPEHEDEDADEDDEMGAPEKPPASAASAPADAGPQEYSFDDEAAAAAPAAPPNPEEFSFEDDAPRGVDTGAAADRELLEVFQAEARECLVALQGYMQALSTDPTDREAASSLERIYHTLKGAAATVGLIDVSATAAGLQDTMEEAVAKGTPLGRAFLEDLVSRTNVLLIAADLPQIALGVTTVPSEDLQRLFQEDAQAVLLHVREAFLQLQEGVPGADGLLAQLFHRLKGSSVVASQPFIADEAARLQEICESGDALRRVEDVARRVERIQDLLAAIAPAPAPAEEAVPSAPLREALHIDVDPVIWEAFEIESGELLESIDRTVFALESSQTPTAEIATLFRQYHTLKGSVNTVGLAGLGKLLHKLEDYLEELQTAPILPPMAGLTTLLLNVHDEVRRNLRHVKDGFLEVDVQRMESEIRSLRAGTKGVLRRGADSQSSARSSDSLARKLPSSARALRESDMLDRRFVRVSVDRLDGLMNLTGELVVSRSRLARRVVALRGLQRDLTLQGGRLSKAIDRFRERHEFQMVGPGRGARPAGGMAVAEFSELELDRYGDVNILARTLNEIGHQMTEVRGRMNQSLDTFSEDASGFSQIVSGLQGEITRARMVPVEQLFLRLRLPVRDAAEREGKSVRVVTEGEDVDLDKAILDELYTPMLHLVRNSVSHGIESPDARRTAGKEPVGTVTLAARQESGQIVIEVRDDGGGLDLEKLHRIAVQRGILPSATPVDDPAVAELVFQTGVSTRADASDVSGRGLGGDVVRREIERLNGSVRISTEKGTGTTFRVTLPLTLAITHALMLRHRGQTYAVPLGLAERIIDLEGAVMHESAGIRRLDVDGTYQTLRSLDAVLGLPTRTEGAPTAALLLRLGDNRLAIAVDRVMGQEEIVVKGLGDVLTGHPLFSGVTVSGDGDLILILDVLGLMQKERPSVERAGTDIAPADDGSRPRVLFIDDSLSVRTVAERFLTALGTDVTVAIDGEDGLTQLRRAPFDLVFTDLEMPRVHGYDLIREIRRTPALSKLPIVVVTSRSGQKHRDQATAVGANDYLTKPFTPELLGRMIRKWVRRDS